MLHGLSQERIVLIVAVALFVIFSATLNGFLSAGNLLSLVQNVSILGILGVGMAIASGRLEPGGRPICRSCPTSAGASTSSRINSPMGAASAF